MAPRAEPAARREGREEAGRCANSSPKGWRPGVSGSPRVPTRQELAVAPLHGAARVAARPRRGGSARAAGKQRSRRGR